jgi:hypothetical protein
MADDSVVPPAAAERMRAEDKERRDAAAAEKAYNKASPLGKSIIPIPIKKARGGGIESRGRTKGRMV